MFQVNHLIGFGAFSADEAEFAIEFIGIVSGGAAELGAPLVLNLPAGIEDGDLILALSSADAGSIVRPTDYVEIFTTSVQVSNTTSYKFRDGDTTVTFPDPGTSDQLACIAMVFRYVDPTTPMDATRTTDGASGGMPDCPSITTVTNNAVVVACGFLDDDDIDTAGLSGFNDVTCVGDTISTAVSSSMAGWARQAVAGAVDPPAFTGSGSDDWWGVTVALRPQFPSASP